MQSETETIIENIELLAGDINEQGYLNGLSTKGFNHYKAWLELCANSIIDARAVNFTIEIIDNAILIIDDGVGMNKSTIVNMFSMHRENHINDKSSGIAGVGGKIALMILSNKTLVEVFSFDGINYIKAIVPWDLMFQEGKYTNMITIKSMNTEEINWFKTKLTNTGTIIKFKSNETTLNTIESNFKITKDLVSNLNDYIYIVFGKYDGNIIYKNLSSNKKDKDIPILLKTYNYFGENDNDYYLGKAKKIIIHYYNPKTEHSRYVYYDEKEKSFYEIKKKGAGYSKKPESISDNLDDYIEVCKYEVETGQRKDKMLFNEEDPNDESNLEYVDSASEKNCAYDKKIVDTISNGDAYFTKVSLYRNNQKIGDIEMTGHKASSARGNAESKHKMKNVRTEVSYSPISYHGNIPDKIIGIQENKNQLESKDIPITLTRLIEHFHTEKANEIWNHFIQITPQKEDREKAEKEAREAQEAKEKAIRVNAEQKAKEKAIAAQKKLEDAEQKQVIDVCEKYIDYLKRNKNRTTIEIFKLQCELLEISP